MLKILTVTHYEVTEVYWLLRYEICIPWVVDLKKQSKFNGQFKLQVAGNFSVVDNFSHICYFPVEVFIDLSSTSAAVEGKIDYK